MRLRVSVFLILLWQTQFWALQNSGAVPKNAASAREDGRVPSGVILVKGSWSSASDSNTPLPEDSSINKGVFVSSYFGISYSLAEGWIQQYYGPPPSDNGRYVLAQINHLSEHKNEENGNLLISADDLFFTRLPVEDAGGLIDYMAAHLQQDYHVELPATDIELGGRPFRVFAYEASVAQLHWYVLATNLRCHAVQFVFTSSEPLRLTRLIQAMNRVTLLSGDAPVCMKNYATAQNLIKHVEPNLGQERFNPIPVRVVIGQDGRISHIHILSAFPDQAKAITEALRQWIFRPYRRNARAVAVETGIVFGGASPTYR